jgi:hypothetical protein
VFQCCRHPLTSYGHPTPLAAPPDCTKRVSGLY